MRSTGIDARAWIDSAQWVEGVQISSKSAKRSLQSSGNSDCSQTQKPMLWRAIGFLRQVSNRQELEEQVVGTNEQHATGRGALLRASNQLEKEHGLEPRPVRRGNDVILAVCSPGNLHDPGDF